MRKLLAIAFAFIAFPGFAQKEGLVVTYDKTFYWIKIFDKLNYLSAEEKSRIQTSWGANDEGDKSKGKLLVTADQSKFTDMEEEADGGYRGRKSEYMVFRDFAKGQKVEVEEFAGKMYVIEDSLVTPSWKVMNKIKDIGGYVCMMAVSEDTVKGQKITAWFANDLAYSAGPERYFGLPGLILEVDINNGELIMTASKVEKVVAVEGLELPKKMKGKKLTTAEYDQMMRKFISDSIKSRRNPYWNIRY